MDVVVRLEVGRAVEDVDARQVELGVLDDLNDQRDVVLLKAELVELGMRLLQGEVRGRERDKPVFNFLLCRHKADAPARIMTDRWRK